MQGVTQIAVGRHHACALSHDGRVRCWGGNAFGQLGDGTTTDHDEPVEVLGLHGVMQLSAGEKHTCARTSQGEVRCWGSNSDGQLGDGSTGPRSAPVAVSFDGVIPR